MIEPCPHHSWPCRKGCRWRDWAPHSGGRQVIQMLVEMDLELHVCNLLYDSHSNCLNQQDGGLLPLFQSCCDPADGSLCVMLLHHKTLVAHSHHSSLPVHFETRAKSLGPPAGDVVPHIQRRR